MSCGCKCPDVVVVGSIAFANPTAKVGLAPVNGVATTAMRSDAAPPIDQGITPTWTGRHNWSVGSNLAIVLSNANQILGTDSIGNLSSLLTLGASDNVDINANLNTKALQLYSKAVVRIGIPVQKDLTNALTPIFDITLTDGNIIAGRIKWSVAAQDGSNSQVLLGFSTFIGAQHSGILDTSITDTVEQTFFSSGVLTATFSLTFVLGVLHCFVTPNTSLTPLKYQLFYSLEQLSPQAVTFL